MRIIIRVGFELEEGVEWYIATGMSFGRPFPNVGSGLQCALGLSVIRTVLGLICSEGRRG
jgi:hypothetical protein